MHAIARWSQLTQLLQPSRGHAAAAGQALGTL
jgi:hypothetical protein